MKTALPPKFLKDKKSPDKYNCDYLLLLKCQVVGGEGDYISIVSSYRNRLHKLDTVSICPFLGFLSDMFNDGPCG